MVEVIQPDKHFSLRRIVEDHRRLISRVLC